MSVSEYPYNGWVTLVWDEPIDGVPSPRVYGIFGSWDAAAAEGRPVNERSNHLVVEVLPLRQPRQIEQEK